MPDLKVEDVKKELADELKREKENLAKAKEAQMSAEEKKALEAKKVEDTKKAEESKKQAEADAKKDEEILTKKDDELKEEEKKRKSELLEKKQKAEDSKLSTEDKIKRVKDETQKRIDELSNKLKQVEDKSLREAELLKSELKIVREEKDALEKKLPSDGKDELSALINKQEKERLDKYLQEDIEKPREQRREISDDEFAEWETENPRAAYRWEARQETRRAIEKIADVNKLRQGKFVKDLTDKQDESNKRVLIRHPELDTSKREAELKAEGKTDDEIQATIVAENEKYRISTEVVKSNPEKYLTQANGPELVAAEMEKRLGKVQSKDNEELSKMREEIESLNAKIAQLENPGDEGLNSTIKRGAGDKTKLSSQEEEMVKIMRENKFPEEKIEAALKKHRNKKGASA